MSKGQGQKAKLLWLKRILEEETDPEHVLTLPQLMERLRAQGVDIRDRKSVYDDLETLRVLGCDIASRREGRQTGYYLDSRTFELAELKLLVDAVQSSRFITRKKTGELIQKVEGLASRHQARQLQRQVFVSRRIKAMNESIYYAVDALYAAIELGERIRFHYFEWALDSASGRAVRRLRKGGDWYECSPWALLWDNENYYLVAFDGPSQSLRHYRVDKMLDIDPTGRPRDVRNVSRDGRDRHPPAGRAAFGRGRRPLWPGDLFPAGGGASGGIPRVGGGEPSVFLLGLWPGGGGGDRRARIGAETICSYAAGGF